jgi:hypothetical protein
MDFPHALAIAERAKAELSPYCQRIDIAGSLRRQRLQVKDIELVAQPFQEPSDLFGETLVAHHGFCTAVNQWRAIKGQPTGKYTQRRLPEGIGSCVATVRDVVACPADVCCRPVSAHWLHMSQSIIGQGYHS